ncbi:MAG: hypothetical protein ACOCVG_03430 [Verrucomicrobiota bacterium]
MSRPLLYLVLGPADSGRGDLVFDLMSDGSNGDANKVLLRHTDDASTEAESHVPALDNAYVLDWIWEGEQLRAPRLDPGAGNGDDVIFLLAPGRDDPRPVIEALPEMLEHYDWELGRIICLIDCQLAAEHPKLRPWWDCCVHFADVVLLGKREDLSNKWIKDFEERYTREKRLPCLFALIKKGHVENPAFVLEPQPRRMSIYFEELIELDEDESYAEAEEGDAPAEERYFERIPGTTRYRIPLPDIRECLD